MTSPEPDAAQGRRTPRVVLDRAPRGASTAPVLDAQQAEVVAHRKGHLLVVAGPGTGKTTTIVEAIAGAITDVDAPVEPDRILSLTFSRKAAAEMRSRLTTRLGGGQVPTVATFHSFAFRLLQANRALEANAELRLMTGPEQHAFVHELMAGALTDETFEWPSSLDGALGTRGLTAEVAAVLGRARSRGLDGEALTELGRAAGQEAWRCIGPVLDEYLAVLDLRGVIDYSELILRAGDLLDDPQKGSELRRAYSLVFVDEFQDTDPTQVALLRSLAEGGARVVAVGDPDQSIYSFRGADRRGIMTFPEQFCDANRAPARVIQLENTRRFGSNIARAGAVILRRSPLSHQDGRIGSGFGGLVTHDSITGPGEVRLETFDTAGAEAAWLADRIARLHADGVPWSDMAVIVRNGTDRMSDIRRALMHSRIPVDVAGDEVPLLQQHAVTVLLDFLAIASRDAITAEEARDLLQSAIGNADPVDVRRMVRAARRKEPELSSDEAVRKIVEDPGAWRHIEAEMGPALHAAQRVHRILRAAAAELAADAGVPAALWAVWKGSAWPDRLREAALRGGPAGLRADADLDSVIALFDAASRHHDRWGHRSLHDFVSELEHQEIPAGALEDADIRGSGVRLLTAHRSKGLEWPVVFVAGVQEGVWPDIRRRASLLEAHRIDVDALLTEPTAAEQLAEERRLFYVACTRARKRLFVSAVSSSSDQGDQPSRFLRELADAAEAPAPGSHGDSTRAESAAGPAEALDGPVLSGAPAFALRHVPGRPRRPLSMVGVVAELRRASIDTDPANADLREAAIRRLAQLALLTDEEGRPRVPSADPARWWGAAARTENEHRPVRPAGDPLTFSASTVEAIQNCPLKWFLEHEARAQTPSATHMAIGSLVHLIAEGLATGEIEPELAAMDAALDRAWPQFNFGAEYYADVRKAEVRGMLNALLDWHRSRSQESLVGAEIRFSVDVEVAGERVIFRGSIDRVELDGDGRVRVIDFKTGAVIPAAEAESHIQLGIYQAAVRAGALDGLSRNPGSGDAPGDHAIAGDGVGIEPKPAGAELVYVKETDRYGLPKVRTQGRHDEMPDELAAVLASAVGTVRSEEFSAKKGPSCRNCDFRTMCPAWAGSDDEGEGA